MFEEVSFTAVQEGILELFKFAFITNCHLDEASVT